MSKGITTAAACCIGLGLAALGLSPAAGQKVTLGQKEGPPLKMANPLAAPKTGEKLGVTVFVPPGKAVPEGLKKYSVSGPLLSDRRLKIGAAEQADVQAALSNPDLHVEFDRPKYVAPLRDVVPFNEDARVSHLVPEFEAAFPGIRGKTVSVAVFDEGRVRATHQEFQAGGATRVTVKSTLGLARHATHCAGTVGAAGVEPKALGMAREVRIVSYDFLNDMVELATDAATFQVSSHSYGPVSGWFPQPSGWQWYGAPAATEDAKYGKYTDDCSQLDVILAGNRNLVTFFAAGNDRGKGPLTQPTVHRVMANNTFSTMVRPRTGGATGMDSVTGAGLAKNVICIGAINDIPQGGGPNTIQITGFTGVGPADDGRIKPDLVANGLQLFSTSDAANDAYVEMSGTSMATPTAAGIGALLWELYKDSFGRNPTSAEIKAALIHTARDGGTPGPDQQYGWGSVDAFAAGRLIKGKVGGLVADPSTNQVGEGETKTFAFAATGDPVRVTAVWTDPAAPPNPFGIDNANPALVNDLDVRVTAPDGTVYLPYSLDLANLWDAANNRPAKARQDRANRVDNVEVVDAKSVSGAWKVEVTGFKVPGGAKQSFALAVTGLTPAKP